MSGITRQGYTGHTALGTMGLNHMNGRVQDSISGRFLSPDPFVTAPGNTQSFNRYSYVHNNPVSYVDLSGFAICFTIQVSPYFYIPYSGESPPDSSRLPNFITVCIPDDVPIPRFPTPTDKSDTSRAPVVPLGRCDAPETSTQDVARQCSAGDQSACAQLAKANVKDFIAALTFIDRTAPDVLARTMERNDEHLPQFTFDFSREFWNKDAGATDPWSGDITLAGGYNSRADLVGTVAHELLHSADGFWGRALTKFQDRWFATEPIRHGQRHTEINVRGNAIPDACH